MTNNFLDLKTVSSGIFGAALGILLTYITAVSAHGQDITRIEVQLENLTLEVRRGMKDRYHRNDAKADFELRDYQIRNNSERIKALTDK